MVGTCPQPMCPRPVWNSLLCHREGAQRFQTEAKSAGVRLEMPFRADVQAMPKSVVFDSKRFIV